MELKDHVSLIDLSKQLPFEIDQSLKEQICFGETLIISCGHYEGDLEEEENSESEWSCEDTSEPTITEEAKGDEMYEVKDYVAEETKNEEEEEEEDDFCFYFFPDCNKPPPPQNSNSSIIVVNGMPKLNSAAKEHSNCTCKKDKTGQCSCNTKLPCHCGAKTKTACICSELKDICLCAPGDPQTVCKCQKADVCVCDPNGKILPVCTCDKIEKPCICLPNKFPSPLCKCKYKPKLQGNIKYKYEAVVEEDYEVEAEACLGEGKVEENSVKRSSCPITCCERAIEEEPCTCQEPDSEEFEEIPCEKDEKASVCSCDATKICTCGEENAVTGCKCFPVKYCTCKNPENCKCFTICECTNPCICDTVPVKPDECVCLKTPRITDSACICTYIEDSTKKIKKVRKGKDGYRWCHEIDPRHAYFDYTYGNRDKFKLEEAHFEKFKIQGLHDEKSKIDECPIHGVKAPKYEKKARKPSLDCCSAVGGINICVESLGEDKDKFLVQVVSYSSKEGAKTGSKLVSILDCNLHTMEENRVEHITKKDLTKERRSYTGICESGYYNKVTRICGERHVVKRFYHTFENAHNFILEGANIVLLRYIALRRFKGNIQTDTVMMDGTICQSIYVCHGVSQGIVNGTPFFVVKIERHIVEPSGYVHQTLTVLSLKGYTISHEWADNCYIFHINPLLRVVPERDEIEQHEPLRDSWRNDLQLMSDFLDFKSTRVSEGGRYVTESGTLTGTVRDYLQAILLLRPQDTLHFTRHYFGTVLSALDLPHDEFFDPTSKHVRYYYFEE